MGHGIGELTTIDSKDITITLSGDAQIYTISGISKINNLEPEDSIDLLHAENKDRLYQHNKILDKLEQRISKLEKVLESHAKCIGEMRENKNE